MDGKADVEFSRISAGIGGVEVKKMKIKIIRKRGIIIFVELNRHMRNEYGGEVLAIYNSNKMSQLECRNSFERATGFDIEWSM